MKFRIEWDYLYKTYSTYFQSEWINGDHVLPIIDDLEKTGRVKEIRIEDETGIIWSKKELKKLLTKLDEEPDELVLYFDASFNKSTYEAGFGTVLYYKLGNEQVRHRINDYAESLDNNNEAEYAALYYSLEQLEQLKISRKKIIIRGDSQGLLMQLKGEWPSYDENLNKWLDKIESKIEKLRLYPEFEIIPRSENKEADKLASQGLEKTMISSRQILS